MKIRKMQVNKLIILVIYFIIPVASFTQLPIQYADSRFRIVFYNVENLFDIYNDSLKLDDEFTPEGVRHWNNRKFYKKLNNIYRVILSVGEWEPPAIVGLCEVENRFVLNKLVYDTPLSKFGYEIIHEESPDKRGIDVAMLYRPDLFKPVSHKVIGIRFPFDLASRTRDILYVKGVVNNSDTIHFFVNHWPSKYGGLMATEPKRYFVASVLKAQVDSLFSIYDSANIIIMGDFNDNPEDESVSKYLRAKGDTSVVKSDELYNLASGLYKKGKTGTHKYQGHWEVLDQFIVSGYLLLNHKGVHISKDGQNIFNPAFLFEPDEKYSGRKPFRTFTGMKYNGGFSDHFPVYVDLKTIIIPANK